MFMKYYNPITKIVAYSTELLVQGVDITNRSVLKELSWFELRDRNDYTYDKKNFYLIKLGIPQFDEVELIYYQDYTIVSLTSVDKVKLLTSVKDKLNEKVNDLAYTDICKGFDTEMMVDGTLQMVHFSYDVIDQSNFSDAANLSMISTMKQIDISTVDWNGYINYNSSTGGNLVVFTLNAIDFLKLHSVALKHKNNLIMLCKEIKSEIDAAVSIDDLLIRMEKYSITVEV